MLQKTIEANEVVEEVPREFSRPNSKDKKKEPLIIHKEGSGFGAKLGDIRSGSAPYGTNQRIHRVWKYVGEDSYMLIHSDTTIVN